MSVAGKKPHVVVVDDDLDIQDLIVAYFRPKGFEVTCFSDAEAAIKECVNAGQSWDVVLTDLRLPKMSGIAFTVQIKKNRPNLPIILITASASAETAVEAVEKGAYDFIVKPIHFPQLRISVARALYLNSLKGDISELREIVKTASKSQNKVIGCNPGFLMALDVAKRVAPSTANILITGESGTGKEVFAKFIHNEGKRHQGPFVAINCSSIPEQLLESELFGHSKGAFTGAQEKRIGLFEVAQDGTLFLDEIGDLSLSLQAKLLRVVQERTIKRVGENKEIPINCRIISATHKDLGVAVKNNQFREDLFFRLNVIPISIPPLRERREDILPLAESFLRRFALENGAQARSFSKEAIKFLLENHWQGNVRELENAVERAVVLCDKYEISLDDIKPLAIRAHSITESNQNMPGENTFVLQYADQLPSLNEVVHRYIEFAVEKNGGARDKTAKELGIDRKTLYKRLRQDMTEPTSLTGFSSKNALDLHAFK